MHSVVELKRHEARCKCDSLASELAAWQVLAAANGPLEKHHRQVERLAVELGGMLTVVAGKVKELEQTTDTGLFFLRLPVVEYLILEVHRTWQFYRQSLVARQGPPFAGLLEALDEFVWSCYHPAFEKSPEPPLVIFTGEWSPTASTRRAPMPIQATSDPNVGRYDQLKGVRLARMVIQVVSLPWYATSFLPLALLLAHEAGHLVEEELGLAGLLDMRLTHAGIDAQEHQQYWLSRRAEVFADLYGVLTVGPAYAGALMMLLSRSRNEVLHTADPDGNYPSHQLRMLIVLRALAGLGFQEQADALESRWAAAYPQGDYVDSVYFDDIPQVICALLHGGLPALPGGRSFSELGKLRWTAKDQADAENVRTRLLYKPPLPLQAPNPRVTLAGAQLAFERQPDGFDPGSFGSDHGPAKIVRHILAQRETGPRGRKETINVRAATAKEQLERDRVSGEAQAQALIAQIEAALAP